MDHGGTSALTSPRTGAEVLVRPVQPEDDRAVLATINGAFATERDLEWFRWKHHDGPWGPSRGWLAETTSGEVVGVRLLLPWRTTLDGTEIEVLRAVDGGILPAWQRRGVFTRLLTEATNGAAGARPLIYSTPVVASREAHLRSGWAVLPPVRHAITLAPASRSRPAQVTFAEVGEHGIQPVRHTDRLTTAWTPDALAWRMRRASGHLYRSARLVQADEDVSLIFRRTTWHGVPTLVVTYAQGPANASAVLVRSVARRLRLPLVLRLDAGTGRGITLGGSVVSLLPGTGPSPRLDPRDPTSWSFSFADLEGVI